MEQAFIHHLESELCFHTGNNIRLSGSRQVFGGDINTTYVLAAGDGSFFVKVNTALNAVMHEKEFAGLDLLRSTNSLKIPQPLLHGVYEQKSYLVLEYLENGMESKSLWQQLATGLALLHKITHITFGLPYNNYIGTLVQDNKPAESWAEFYANRRILPLTRQAYDKHLCPKATAQMAEQFCNKLASLLPAEGPALLHGDLWSGNKMFTAKGETAVYDPAVYYGHREMDLGMTLLFGGFDQEFYHAYNEAFPLQKGWQQRTSINQLYPLLVHLILFGGHYYDAVHVILKKYT